MKWTLILAFAVCLMLGTQGSTEARPWHHSPTDAACMRLMRVNHLPLDSAKADWLGNYHGCDEAYNSAGTLIGYTQGTSYCERLAYSLTMRQHLSGLAMHTRMGGKCVLYEDWSWGPE